MGEPVDGDQRQDRTEPVYGPRSVPIREVVERSGASWTGHQMSSRVGDSTMSLGATLTDEERSAR